MVGKNWGLTPRMTLWIYKQIILPRITYGCLIWWHKADIAIFKNKLNKLQRMAELAITGSPKTTPTAALDAILGLVPLSVAIEAKAKSSAIRLASNKQWYGSNQTYCHCKINEFLNNNKSYWTQSDKISLSFDFSKPFEIVINDERGII